MSDTRLISGHAYIEVDDEILPSSTTYIIFVARVENTVGGQEDWIYWNTGWGANAKWLKTPQLKMLEDRCGEDLGSYTEVSKRLAKELYND
jgi:hypothetical protein